MSAALHVFFAMSCLLFAMSDDFSAVRRYAAVSGQPLISQWAVRVSLEPKEAAFPVASLSGALQSSSVSASTQKRKPGRPHKSNTPACGSVGCGHAGMQPGQAPKRQRTTWSPAEKRMALAMHATMPNHAYDAVARHCARVFGAGDQEWCRITGKHISLWTQQSGDGRLDDLEEGEGVSRSEHYRAMPEGALKRGM